MEYQSTIAVKAYGTTHYYDCPKEEKNPNTEESGMKNPSYYALIDHIWEISSGRASREKEDSFMAALKVDTLHDAAVKTRALLNENNERKMRRLLKAIQ